jgi:hypothetical protein
LELELLAVKLTVKPALSMETKVASLVTARDGASVVVKMVASVFCARDAVLGLALAVSPTMVDHCPPLRSIAPNPKTALAVVKGGAVVNAPPALKCSTASGRKPTVFTTLLPGDAGACQVTTLAETCGPPMAT